MFCTLVKVDVFGFKINVTGRTFPSMRSMLAQHVVDKVLLSLQHLPADVADKLSLEVLTGLMQPQPTG